MESIADPKEMMYFIKSLTTQKQEKKEEKTLRRPLEHCAFAKRVLLRLLTD